MIDSFFIKMNMKMCWVKSEEFIAVEKYVVCFTVSALCFGFYIALSAYYDRKRRFKKLKNEDSEV
jgi:hypothetical protein